VILDKFKLDGRVALVTGGGRGIGREIARCFIEAGARTIIAEVDSATGEATAKEFGPLAHFLELDVSKSASVDEAAVKVMSEYGQIDILVNNAAICINSDAADTTDATWRRQMDINLDGVFYCCRAFGRHMISRGSGSIVNISSTAAVIDIRPQHHIAYSAAKAGVAQLSRVLASEWARHGVRVNAVLPGYTKTAMPLGAGKELISKWMEMIPMGRWLEPAEIAASVFFLASDAASGVTGHLMVVDGGYTVW
jgi:NAD(P)-dependent dehydrogenase (short-subunit alcohol dehydrogenase family)